MYKIYFRSLITTALFSLSALYTFAQTPQDGSEINTYSAIMDAATWPNGTTSDGQAVGEERVACNAGTISGTTTICQGVSTQISSNGDSGSWSSSNTAAVLINAPNGLMVGRAGGTSIISYTVTDGTCTSTATTVVTVNTRPNAAIAITENFISGSFPVAYYNVSLTDGILCTGPDAPSPSTSATLTASGGGTYLWSNGSTNNPITVSTANTYTVVVTNALGCQSTASQTISVNTAPSAGTISATPYVFSSFGFGLCTNATLTLSSTVPGGVWEAYNKSPNNVVSTDPVTGFTMPLVSTASVDSHMVFYRVTFNGCRSSARVQVEVLESPNAGTISGTTSVCAGLTTQLSSNGTTASNTIRTWSSSNTAAATVGASSGLVTGVASGMTTITYTVTDFAVTNSGTLLLCTSTTSTIVTVGAGSNAGTITGTTTVCAGATSQLTSTGDPGGTWSSSNTPVATVSSSGLVAGVSGNSGTSTITYTVTAGNCTSSASVLVTVNASPNAGSISGNTSICSSPFLGNNTTQLSIIGGAGGGTWASSNTNVATVNGSGLVSSVPPSTNSGTSIISYTVTNGSCTNTATALVTVNTNPSALVTSTPYNACINTDVTISVPDAGTGATYVWGGDIANTNSNTIVSNTSTPGFKIYSVTVTAANGCSNTGFGSHIVNQPSNTTITATPNPVCFGLTLSLSIPEAASTTASWAGPGINNTNGFSTTASPTTTGLQTYTVTATTNAFLGNCVYTGTVDVMVETTQPTCNITGPTLVCPGSTSSFNAPNGLSGYSWGVTGDGMIVGGSTGSSVSVTAVTSGTYTVNLTVTSASGCTNTCSQIVTVNTVPSCPSTYAPLNGQLGVPVAASALSWGSVPNVTHYLVYFGSNAPNYDNIFNGVNNGTSTSKSYTTLAASTTYGYRIVPVNACGEAVGCPTITFSTCVPSFTCPANRNVNLSATCTMTIPDLVTGLAANPGCGSLNFTQSPTAGTVVSSSHNATVVITIMPDNPAVSTCQVTLTGKDVTPPTITCPAHQTAVPASAATCTAVVNGINAVVADNCAAVLTYTRSNATTGGGTGQASGLSFNSGLTTVTYTATDAGGNMTSCAFLVTVAPCLSGKIIWKQDNVTGVKNVTVAVTGDQNTSFLTGVNGLYSFIFPSGSNFTITPSKEGNKFNGVNAQDVFRIMQHNSGNLITNPYQLIAADVNSNDLISALDANIIQLSLLGNTQAQGQMIKSWRFVPTSHAMSNPPWGFPEDIFVSAGGNQTGQDFYGIKVGDVVAGYANPANAGPGNLLVLRTPDQTLQAGQTIRVALEADPFMDLAALQFALGFDPGQLQLENIETLDGLPLQTDNFGAYETDLGKLRFLWAANGPAVAFKQSASLFRLRFKVLESGSRLSEVVYLDDETLAGHVYDSKSAESGVSLRFDASTAVGNPVGNGQVLLLQNRPNPFVQNTSIGFVLPEACAAQLRIFDAAGRLVAERVKQYPAGRHDEPFDLSGVSGLLYYELTTPFGVLAKKMVVVEE